MAPSHVNVMALVNDNDIAQLDIGKLDTVIHYLQVHRDNKQMEAANSTVSMGGPMRPGSISRQSLYAAPF